jgi:hypothetical protein
MTAERYSVRIGESRCIAEDVSYDALLARIVEFTIRSAVARSIDESEWEHEELRRKGLSALQVFRNGKALWDDAAMFETEFAEARREHVGNRFESTNEPDAAFYEKLDRDLRLRWRHAGYETPSLQQNMKRLFKELERDVADRAADARESLLSEVLRAQSQET